MLNTLKTYYTHSVFPRCGIFDIIIDFLKIDKNMFRVFPQINRKQKKTRLLKPKDLAKELL